MRVAGVEEENTAIKIKDNRPDTPYMEHELVHSARKEKSIRHNKVNVSCLCVQRRLRSAWASAHSDQSSLCAFWVAKDPMFLQKDSEDSEQTGLIYSDQTGLI